jgi:hypothetical protein
MAEAASATHTLSPFLFITSANKSFDKPNCTHKSVIENGCNLYTQCGPGWKTGRLGHTAAQTKEIFHGARVKSAWARMSSRTGVSAY